MLNRLKYAPGSVKTKKRLGRGQGSGLGGTSTKGNKGDQSRSGYKRNLGYEGGQMPLHRRVPKFGFTNVNRVEFKPVNIAKLQLLAETHSITDFNPAIFKTYNLCSTRDKVKILGKGELKAKINVQAHGFSKTAIDAIQKAGGLAQVITHN